MNVPDPPSPPGVAPGPAGARGRLLTVIASPVTRLALLAALFAVAVVLALRVDDLSIAALRAIVDETGLLAPVVYTLLYAVAVTVMFPASPLTIAAGVLFGPALGIAITLVGATIGAVGGFGVARGVGRGPVEQLAGRRVKGIDRFVTDRGLFALLILRFVPLIPFSVLNLAAGVTAIRLRDYTLGTALGIVPGTVAFVAVGGTLDDPTSPAFAAAVGLLVGVMLIAAVAARRMRRRGDVPSA